MEGRKEEEYVSLLASALFSCCVEGGGEMGSLCLVVGLNILQHKYNGEGGKKNNRSALSSRAQIS